MFSIVQSVLPDASFHNHFSGALPSDNRKLSNVESKDKPLYQTRLSMSLVRVEASADNAIDDAESVPANETKNKTKTKQNKTKQNKSNQIKSKHKQFKHTRKFEDKLHE